MKQYLRCNDGQPLLNNMACISGIPNFNGIDLGVSKSTLSSSIESLQNGEIYDAEILIPEIVEKMDLSAYSFYQKPKVTISAHVDLELFEVAQGYPKKRSGFLVEALQEAIQAFMQQQDPGVLMPHVISVRSRLESSKGTSLSCRVDQAVDRSIDILVDAFVKNGVKGLTKSLIIGACAYRYAKVKEML